MHVVLSLGAEGLRFSFGTLFFFIIDGDGAGLAVVTEYRQCVTL
jgi:hypothetical protein